MKDGEAFAGAENCKPSSSAAQGDPDESPASGGAISLRSPVQYQDEGFEGFCVPLSLASALHTLLAIAKKKTLDLFFWHLNLTLHTQRNS